MVVGMVSMSACLHLPVGATSASNRQVVSMISQILPLVGGAYSVIGLFYASMATLDGQARA